MTLPLVLSADAVPEPLPGGLKPIDLRPAEAFESGHLPGARRIESNLLNKVAKPVGGLLPDPDVVNRMVQEAGLDVGDHVLAYDGGAATEAARLIWVLHAYGYSNCSWLDGGFPAWQRQGRALESGPVSAHRGTLELGLQGDNVIDAKTLLTRLDADDLSLLDVRSLAEFRGEDVRSAVGGHIPGAQHLEWTAVFEADGTLKQTDELNTLFGELNIDRDDEVVVYCQTHQRSAVTYVVLKALGYDSVVALDGAWSNWGNRADTPKAQ